VGHSAQYKIVNMTLLKDQVVYICADMGYGRCDVSNVEVADSKCPRVMMSNRLTTSNNHRGVKTVLYPFARTLAS
jgi:hypothetical protein